MFIVALLLGGLFTVLVFVFGYAKKIVAVVLQNAVPEFDGQPNSFPLVVADITSCTGHSGGNVAVLAPP